MADPGSKHRWWGSKAPDLCATPCCLLKMLSVANAKSFDCAIIKSLQIGSCYSFGRLLSGFPKKLLTGRISETMLGKKAILMKKGTVLFKEFL